MKSIESLAKLAPTLPIGAIIALLREVDANDADSTTDDNGRLTPDGRAALDQLLAELEAGEQAQLAALLNHATVPA